MTAGPETRQRVPSRSDANHQTPKRKDRGTAGRGANGRALVGASCGSGAGGNAAGLAPHPAGLVAGAISELCGNRGAGEAAPRIQEHSGFVCGSELFANGIEITGDYEFGGSAGRKGNNCARPSRRASHSDSGRDKKVREKRGGLRNPTARVASQAGMPDSWRSELARAKRIQ